MQQNSFDNIIISDTSCLIALTQINQLDLLKDLYGTVVITPEIASEFKNKKTLPDWIKIKNAENTELVKTINQHLDIGESTAIALANETKNSLLIIDDDKGRKYALSMGLLITGTIGVLRQAYDRGFVESPEKALGLINKLKEKSHFRISEKVMQNFESHKVPHSRRVTFVARRCPL